MASRNIVIKNNTRCFKSALVQESLRTSRSWQQVPVLEKALPTFNSGDLRVTRWIHSGNGSKKRGRGSLPGGGTLGYFLGGYVPPGTPNWHPVLKKNPLKLIPRSRIRSKTDTPFQKWANFLYSALRCKECNILLVNALNRIFKSNLSLNNFKWLLTKFKLELSCVRNIIPRSRKRL